MRVPPSQHPPRGRVYSLGVTFMQDVTGTDFVMLLKLVHRVGVQLSSSGSVYRQAWGHHLLEDWRSLELLTDKLIDQESDRAR